MGWSERARSSPGPERVDDALPRPPMSTIQRIVIEDSGSRVALRNNHQLGLVFALFAAIPLMAPFHSTSSGLGALLTTAGALGFLALGAIVFLRRRALKLELTARTLRVESGYWPWIAVREGPLNWIRSVELVESRKRARPTWEVRFALEGDEAPFVLFESERREEALEVQRSWRERLAPPPAPLARAA